MPAWVTIKIQNIGNNSSFKLNTLFCLHPPTEMGILSRKEINPNMTAGLENVQASKK